MSDAVLHFLPWIRRGLSRLLTDAVDEDGVPKSGLGSLTASVSVGTESAERAVQVRGPGAVVGLTPGQVVRRHPAPNTLDFERNYFPHVEVASPDLPWMFTSGKATDDRLLPWLVLVVVEEREGVRYRSGSPLPVLEVDDADLELPDLRQAFAWAHVQSATSLDDGAEAAFAKQPEAFVARLMSPRRLEVETWYRACLVPAFRAGQQAGLGQDFAEDDAELAWVPGDTDVRLPVYESWRFRTATEPGDFETLVRRLVARTLETDVGAKALDIGDPGSDLLPRSPGEETLFVGALTAPDVVESDWQPPHRRNFKRKLRSLLNTGLAADAGDEPEEYDPLQHDPVVMPPAYGALPGGVDTIPLPAADPTDDEPRWLSQANLDPAHRAAAGLGAEVVRRNQESLMASAWDQAAEARKANALLNQARLALEVGRRFKKQIDDPSVMDDGTLLQFSRGAHHRIKGGGMDTTVRGRLRQSAVPDGLVSAAFRRRFNAGSTFARACEEVATGARSVTLSGGITGEFVADPQAKLAFAEFTVPPGVVTAEGVVSEAIVDERLAEVTRAPLEELGVRVDRRATVSRATRRVTAAPMTFSRTSAPSPPPTPAAPMARTSVERVVSPITVGTDTADPEDAEVASTADVVRSGLDPEALLRVRVRHLIQPSGLLGPEPVPASLKIDPQFPDPTYELLVRIDPELLMPGVGTIPKDTVALAVLNAAFVEAFLLGANHELGREFLWREFPAEPTDTWLRTFWDSVEGDETTDSGAVEDVPRVAAWAPSALNTHSTYDPDQVLVLIVKGDLLRRYPNTLVYATRGDWSQRTIDAGGPNERTVDERVEPDPAEHLHPSFVGSLGADVTFLGFQFPAHVKVDEDVVGSEEVGGDAGWFFVFEELPTEPRFGMDEGKPKQATKKPTRWENLSWYHALGEAKPAYVDLLSLPDRHGELNQRYDNQGPNDWREEWGTTSAAMARITLQRPVRMLVHADQMLRPAPIEEDG